MDIITLHNIFEKQFWKKPEWNTNPSLTLAGNLTLSTVEGNLISRRRYPTIRFTFWYILIHNANRWEIRRPLRNPSFTWLEARVIAAKFEKKISSRKFIFGFVCAISVVWYFIRNKMPWYRKKTDAIWSSLYPLSDHTISVCLNK